MSYMLLCLLIVTAGCTKQKQTAFNTVDKTTDSTSIITLDHIDSHGLDHTHTIPIGDVNGDNRLDTATLYCPNASDQSTYITRVHFSNDIPNLIDSMSTGAIIARAGDVDGNGTDDLLFLPDWIGSCWIEMTAYGLREEQWEVFGGGLYYRCNNDPYNPDSLSQRIRIIEPGLFELLVDTLKETGLSRTTVAFDIRSDILNK